MGIASPQARWRDVAAGLVLGELAATALLLLPLWGLWWLGLVPHLPTSPSSLSGWPYPFDGAWSVATDLTIMSALAAAAAVVVVRPLRSFTGRPVSVVRTAGVLLLAGGVPFAWSSGLVRGGVLGFLLALAGIRAFAVGVAPRRLARRTLVLAAVGSLVLLVSAAGFGVLHPLRVSGTGGPGPVLVLGVDSPFSVRVTGVEPHGWTLPAWFSFRPVDVRIDPHGTAPLFLRTPPCPRGASGFANVGVVSVSYVTLGRSERQLLTVSPPLELHCP